MTLHSSQYVRDAAERAKHSKAPPRAERNRMSDTQFYARLEIANEFERLATAMRGDTSIAASFASVVASALDERASRIRGELQREADRQSRESEDRDTRPWTTGDLERE